jgi:hypothetical protein
MNMAYSDFLATHPPIFSGAKVGPVTLHRVLEDSVCRTTAERSSSGLVGVLYRNTVSGPPCGVG